MRIWLRGAAIAAIASAMSLPAWAAGTPKSQSSQNEKQAGQPNKRTAIHFADLGNVWSWHASNANEMYIQSNDKKWYRVTFWSPCYELPYAISVAFVTEPNGDLSSYSSVLVRGERCWFKTFERSEGPPSKAKKQHGANEGHEPDRD